ncbi:MAG: glycosyltransferase family A protein [Geminicoccaceae bacterium]
MSGLPVTCILPAHDSASFIALALASVLAQTQPPAEILVVDDGSTDGTAAIAAAVDPRITILRTDDQGPAAARNRGLAATSSPLVAFLDPDDLWLPDKLQRQQAALTRTGRRLALTHVESFWSGPPPPGAGHPRTGIVPGYATPALLAERSLFDEIGPFDESLWFADALDWLIRVEAAGHEIAMLPEALVRRRLHGNNLTTRRDADSRAEFLAVVHRRLRSRRAAAA